MNSLTKNQRKLIQFSKKIQTIGIKNLTLEQFINSLKKILETNVLKIFSNGQHSTYKLGDTIVIVDIRQSVIYKAEEGFGPEKLKTELEKNGMEYLHYGMEYLHYNYLGNPRYKDKDKKNISPDEIKQFYLQYIKTGEAQRTFIDLFNRIDSKHPHKIYCLLCYCTNYVLCHRAWLKQALVNEKRMQLGLEPDYVIQIPKSITEKVMP